MIKLIIAKIYYSTLSQKDTNYQCCTDRRVRVIPHSAGHKASFRLIALSCPHVAGTTRPQAQWAHMHAVTAYVACPTYIALVGQLTGRCKAGDKLVRFGRQHVQGLRRNLWIFNFSNECEICWQDHKQFPICILSGGYGRVQKLGGTYSKTHWGLAQCKTHQILTTLIFSLHIINFTALNTELDPHTIL